VTFLHGKHVRANGIRQHYLRYGGQGPAVVFVPGIVSPAALWDRVGRWLGRTHDCYVLDVRGRGLSEAGPHLDYGVDACARDVLEFAHALGLAAYVLVGHSMGARIAVRAGGSADASMTKIVLLDPPTSGPGRRPYPVPIERTLSAVRAAHRGEAEELLRRPDQPLWPEDLLLLRAEWLATCDERAVHVVYDNFHCEDMFTDISSARVPLSLVCAGRGGVVSEEDVREMLHLQPKLQVARLPNAGHQMQVDDFDGFCDALASALAAASPDDHRRVQ
jgi:N-formylmaleamate deformylase